ncbi:hypothetical protein [Streptomyces sp. NBC_00268]|uniref:hypothetical protein n=1 Tax=Streptomyces sp. NBC_00268 TaxID=2975695 RepID=UPI00224D5A6F|nr:hypothetical protein [Streptomyces sp. NBC_00268]MCX5181555.1 hypothetical protein [Streptomyces sp. NBC_00268]
MRLTYWPYQKPLIMRLLAKRQSLVNTQQALGSAHPAADADTATAPSVPHQASAQSRHSEPRSAAEAEAEAG